MKWINFPIVAGMLCAVFLTLSLPLFTNAQRARIDNVRRQGTTSVRLGQPRSLGPGVNLGPAIAPLDQPQPVLPPRLVQIINTITNYALGIVLALAVIFIIYAAFLYLNARGEPTEINTAKNALIYSVVAVAVAVAAYTIVQIVSQVFGNL